MSNQEILESAIEKAIDNGWTNFGHGKNWEWTIAFDVPIGIHYPNDAIALGLRINDIIFNHDFAKALWGEEKHRITGENAMIVFADSSWKYHLQQMVIADDPIQYLGENI